ncbi:MAG: Holliday junction resolvase RuvX, partial [Muribaculaceae bacterium]|nr:Holliday junction resolvase RuvX [Muribaculaceae bacterium]
MGRLLCIDYGKRRCGIAATDPLRIVATAVATVDSSTVLDFIKDYIGRESVDAIVIGRPTTMRGEPSESMKYITPFVKKLQKALPLM